MNFSETLLAWYREEGRPLPWREEITPYKVWLSEIIMQQTRVAQGLPYFNKFFKALPDIEAFAKADQDYILLLWQGLGYYSRARNMHAAAQQVINDFDGQFPSSFTELKELKGVGDYTAAAIASIAFGLPNAVVDGNVYRVLSRYYNISTPIDSTEGKKLFQKLADELISKKEPGDYNQAIMDFGAMICTPKTPNCDSCSLKESCAAKAKKTIGELPVKSKKIKVTHRFLEYFEICFEDQILIQQRSEKDIWLGLFQLPLVEVYKKEDAGEKNISKLLPNLAVEIEKKAEKKHVLSHQKLHANFYQVILADRLELEGEYIWVNRADVEAYAFPKLISNYLED